MFHVDVLDGSLFNSTCWSDPEIVGEWKNLPDIELHCMVQNPLPIIELWQQHVSTLKRVIVHAEIGQPVRKLIPELRALNLEVVLAVNPLTPVDSATGHPIDALLIMGVEPGAAGQPFLGEVIVSKIKRAHALFPNLKIAVDGGVSEANVASLWKAGACRCAASSALWKAENPVEAYRELQQKLS